MIEQLVQLQQIASAQHDASIARLVQHDRQITDIEQRINSLRQRQNAAYDAPNPSDLSLSLTSGHYDTWQRWIERELMTLNNDLALARAERETLVSAARLSFGRHSATTELLAQHLEDKRINARKRHEQLLSNR